MKGGGWGGGRGVWWNLFYRFTHLKKQRGSTLTLLTYECKVSHGLALTTRTRADTPIPRSHYTM